MIRDSATESALDLAARRLERAVVMLEQRMNGRAGGPPAPGDGGGLFDPDPGQLAAELEKARARERELEAAGAEASAALGRAIAEIRAALSAPAEPAEA